jgi:hypothetical protein
MRLPRLCVAGLLIGAAFIVGCGDSKPTVAPNTVKAETVPKTKRTGLPQPPQPPEAPP